MELNLKINYFILSVGILCVFASSAIVNNIIKLPRINLACILCSKILQVKGLKKIEKLKTSFIDLNSFRIFLLQVYTGIVLKHYLNKLTVLKHWIFKFKIFKLSEFLKVLKLHKVLNLSRACLISYYWNFQIVNQVWIQIKNRTRTGHESISPF